MLLIKTLHHLSSPFSFLSMTWPFQGSLQLRFTPCQLRTEEEREKEMNKALGCPNADSVPRSAPRTTPSSLATASPSPHGFLRGTGSLLAGAPDKALLSHRVLIASMTQGTSEISLSVVTDTICKAAMVTAQRFALHSFGETKLEPVLVARITERALFFPSAPASR